jgi:hypothetical protein
VLLIFAGMVLVFSIVGSLAYRGFRSRESTEISPRQKQSQANIRTDLFWQRSPTRGGTNQPV